MGVCSMSRILFIASLLAALLFVTSCATAPHGATVVDSPDELPSIQQKNADLLSKLKIGMPLSNFQQLVPDAYVAGQNEDTTAYELSRVQKYVTQSDIERQNFFWGGGSPNARTTKQVLWFYFYKGQLVKWGRPQDWPEHPDLIIEQHNR